MKKKGKKLVNPRFAKGGGYGEIINSIASIGHCPFCPENFKYHKKPALKKMGGWFITESRWPYKNSQKHFLIISTKHHETLGELKAADMRTILSLATWAVKRYKIKGGGLTMRFGDSDFTGATVSHLHAHLIYPQETKAGIGKTVNFPIG
ncbi:MAG: HIT domain-containing protein [Patescibacteria group bacterium]